MGRRATKIVLSEEERAELQRWRRRRSGSSGLYVRFFTGRTIGTIARRDAQVWFGSLHATPAAANRSPPILSVIMQQAEAWGYRPENSNPCRGLQRYRPAKSERFLSMEEYRRLGRVLDRHAAKRPLHVAALRLLLLTGCRKGKVLSLEWSFYREGTLYLPDSKTGVFFPPVPVGCLRYHAVSN